MRRCSWAARSASGWPGCSRAIGTLAAGWRGDAHGELVDVSMLEALVMCLTYYPVTFNDQLGRPMRRRRFVPTPGVGAASDGLVGLGVGTGQQWLDFCAMVGHPEWTEDPSALLGPHGPGADDRRVDRPAHRRRGARPGLGLPHPQRADRQRRERHDLRPLPRSGNVCRQPDRRRGEPSPALPARRGSPPDPEPAPRLGQHSIDDVPAAARRASAADRARTQAVFRSRACGSST